MDQQSFDHLEGQNGLSPHTVVAYNLMKNIKTIYDFLGVGSDSESDRNSSLYPLSPIILVSPHEICAVCPQDELHSLCRQADSQPHYLDLHYHWCKALLYVAYCPWCCFQYFPNQYSFKEDEHFQWLESNPMYICVSKWGVWMHYKIAEAQKHAVFCFHCGWSNFASWINNVLQQKPAVTNWQAQRLFTEHMSHRLLLAHGSIYEFKMSANSTTQDLAHVICDVIGCNGGHIPSSLHYVCKECTHKKGFTLILSLKELSSTMLPGLLNLMMISKAIQASR